MSNSTEQNTKRVVYQDGPITSPEDDEFGFDRIAKNIADSILKYPHKTGVVYGLYGSWGSGKSSMLNLIEKHLKDEKPKCWWCRLSLWFKRNLTLYNFVFFILKFCIKVGTRVIGAGLGFIIGAETGAFIGEITRTEFGAIFVTTIGSGSGLILGIILGTKLSYYLLKVAYGIAEWKNVPGLHETCCSCWFGYLNKMFCRLWNPKIEAIEIVRFSPWLFSGKQNITYALLNAIQNQLSKSGNLSQTEKRHLSNLLMAILNLAEIIPNPKVKLAASAIKSMTKWKNNDKNVEEVKNKVNDLLDNSKIKRIVVYIDDVDRLFPEEIVQILSALKALADFDKVTYILSCDRDIVAKAITHSNYSGLVNTDTGNCNIADGLDFLEKIVQVSLTVPILDENSLRDYFESLLTKTFGKSEFRKQIKDRKALWNAVFALIKTPRQAKRVANSLSATYPIVKCYDVFQLEFLTVEMIRILNPDLYFDLFKTISRYLSHNNMLPLKFVKNYRSQNSRIFGDVFLKIIVLLFTPDNSNAPPHAIRNSECFRLYFCFAGDPSYISNQTLRDLFIANEKNLNKLRTQLLKYKMFLIHESFSFYSSVIHKLIIYLDEFSPEGHKNLLRIMLDTGDEFRITDEIIDQENKDGHYLDDRVTGMRLMNDILRIYKDNNEKMETIKNSLTESFRDNSESLRTKIDFLRGLLTNKTARIPQCYTDKVFTDQLMEFWKKKIRDKFQKMNFLDFQDRILLYRWKEFDENSANQYFENALQRNDILVHYVKLICFQKNYDGYTFRPRRVELFINFKVCLERLKGIVVDQISDGYKKPIQAYIECASKCTEKEDVFDLDLDYKWIRGPYSDSF